MFLVEIFEFENLNNVDLTSTLTWAKCKMDVTTEFYGQKKNYKRKTCRMALTEHFPYSDPVWPEFVIELHLVQDLCICSTFFIP